MAMFLAYLEPVPGRLYPLVATLQELDRRCHRIVGRSGADQASLLRSVGIDAGLLAPGLARFEPQDWPGPHPVRRADAGAYPVR